MIACPIGSPVGVTAAAFAPRAAQIAYARPAASGFEIDEAGLDGRRVRVVLRGAGASPTILRWSPTDGQLAFVRGSELHVVGAGVDHTLWSGAAPLELGGWTSNGTALVVSSADESYLVDAASGAAHDLGPGTHAVPSPDGTRVALVVSVATRTSPYAENLVVVSLADGARQTIYKAGNPLVALAWSPDSRQIAFLDDMEVAEPELLAQNADGSSTSFFGRDHGALPTEIGMRPPFAWTESGIAGFSLSGATFYNPLSGKVVYSRAFGQTITGISRSGQIAYLNRDGLRLARFGSAGPDRTLFPCRGTAGPDQIRLGKAPTTVEAGAGNDAIYARNYRVDTIDCGPGHDVVWADRRDIVRNCEVVHRR